MTGFVLGMVIGVVLGIAFWVRNDKQCELKLIELKKENGTLSHAVTALQKQSLDFQDKYYKAQDKLTQAHRLHDSLLDVTTAIDQQRVSNLVDLDAALAREDQLKTQLAAETKRADHEAALRVLVVTESNDRQLEINRLGAANTGLCARLEASAVTIDTICSERGWQPLGVGAHACISEGFTREGLKTFLVVRTK